MTYALYLLAVGGIIALQYIYFLLLSYRERIPGPFLARFSRLWYFWQIKNGDFHWTNVKLHQKEGNIVRIAPNWYSVSDPDAIKILYGHGTQLSKGEWYSGSDFKPDPTLTNLFTERDPQKHGEKRRKVAQLYAMSSLMSYEPYVDKCIDLLLPHFDSFAARGSEINLRHWLQCYAFDVVSEISFSNSFGFLRQGKDEHQLMDAIDQSMALTSYLGLYLWIKPTLIKLLSLLSNPSFSYLDSFINQHISRTKHNVNRKSSGESEDMMRKLIKAHNEAPGTITEWDLQTTAGANIGAGSDTTAISLSAAIFYLYRSPKSLQRVRQELLDHSIVLRPSFKSVQKLPYFQAVIKEALRMHPATGLPLFRVSPKGGITVSGHFFPENTTIGMNSWVAHQDTRIYGSDAHLFRPERWLEASEEQLKAMERSFMAFGLGSRTCIGKNVALLEMTKLIPVLIYRYDFEFSPEYGDLLEADNKFLVKPRTLKARLRINQS